MLKQILDHSINIKYYKDPRNKAKFDARNG